MTLKRFLYTMPGAQPMKGLNKPLLTLFLSATLFAVCFLPLCAAQSPTTAETVPVFPDAVYDRAAEAEHDRLLEVPIIEGNGPLGNEIQGLGLLAGSKKVYITKAKAEEVVRFYRDKIGGIPGSCSEEYINTRIDLAKIKPGTGSPIEYALCLSGGGYREHVFRWIVRTDEDAVQCLAVVIKDMSAAYDGKTFKVRTYLVVLGKSYSRKAPRVVVTERDLGLPLYPGATLDVNTSTRMNLGDCIRYEYVFISGDSQAEIVAFYERRLGRKATESDGGKRVFILPDQEYLVVNPRGDDRRTTIVMLRNSRPNTQ